MDNGHYGTIRMHQEREYPGRVVGTQLRNPDFAALARAFGGHGETVEKTAEFEGAFERALAAKAAGDHPCEGRSGGDHADDDADRDPRGGAEAPGAA